MNRLIGLSLMNTHPRSGRALKRGRAELKTHDCGCDMRLFAEGLDGASSSDSELPVYRIDGKLRRSFCFMSPISIPLMLGHCFGGKPTPGGAALFCFGFAAQRVTVSIEIFSERTPKRFATDPP